MNDATIITYGDITQPEPEVKVNFGPRELIDEAIAYVSDPPMVPVDCSSTDGDGNNIGGVEYDYEDQDLFAFCQWVADMDERLGDLAATIESAPRFEVRNRETLDVVIRMVWRCYSAFSKAEIRLDKEAEERKIELAVAERLRQMEMDNAADPFLDEEGEKR